MLPHLVAAPDKYRGTASAAAVADAIGRAARAHGWTADEVPLSDGGEGMLEALGGTPRRTLVTGPLGRPVVAEWRMLEAGLPIGQVADGPSSPPLHAVLPPTGGPTAVIEAARVVGRALVPSPKGDDPVRATTTGVGELVLAAVAAGARQVVVGAGGSATSDGGWGAVTAIGSPDRLQGTRLVVAYDVRAPFRSAAAVFGPQKGATPAQVVRLGRRLELLADRYRHLFGVDVDALVGGGAAGGLAGGLGALGAVLVPGFDMVAAAVGLERRLAGAGLVVTGEGHLDATSFDGKVVGRVVEMVGGRAPVLCIVGDADGDVELPRRVGDPKSPVEVVTLVTAVGPRRAWGDTAEAAGEVVAARLSALG